MRQAFIETLHHLALKDKKIILMNGDLGFSVLEEFTAVFPDRSYNMGVAEANMMGAAAGCSFEGYTVFVYSIIPFVTMRVFEQVRNDVAMQNANVKIVGVGSGFTYGQLGPTHHAIEDIAVMRTIPNMTVVCPGDPAETREATKALVKHKGPAYLRIGKKGEPEVHTNSVSFALGKSIPVRIGKDGIILVTGNMLHTAVTVADNIKKNGIHISVISIPVIKPIDKKGIIEAVRQSGGNIFTLEEHTIVGGLGSAVSEFLLEDNIPVRSFHRFGVNDIFTYQAGSQEYLRRFHNLTPDCIIRDILQILKKR